MPGEADGVVEPQRHGAKKLLPQLSSVRFLIVATVVRTVTERNIRRNLRFVSIQVF